MTLDLYCRRLLFGPNKVEETRVSHSYITILKITKLKHDGNGFFVHLLLFCDVSEGRFFIQFYQNNVNAEGGKR